MKLNRKLQIGVMGSAADLEKDQTLFTFAEEVGKEIAKSGNILVFGADHWADCWVGVWVATASFSCPRHLDSQPVSWLLHRLRLPRKQWRALRTSPPGCSG
mgnify:CR=1 FL=1